MENFPQKLWWFFCADFIWIINMCTNSLSCSFYGLKKKKMQFFYSKEPPKLSSFICQMTKLKIVCSVNMFKVFPLIIIRFFFFFGFFSGKQNTTFIKWSTQTYIIFETVSFPFDCFNLNLVGKLNIVNGILWSVDPIWTIVHNLFIEQKFLCYVISLSVRIETNHRWWIWF